MTKIYRYILTLLGLCLAFGLSAQVDSLSNWRYKSISVEENGSYKLDSLTIIASTAELFDSNTGQKISSRDYLFLDNKLIWYGVENPSITSIDIRYRVLPFSITADKQNRDTTYIRNEIMPPDEFIYDPFAEDSRDDDIFGSQGIDYNGSFSRGISFGNSQNLVLNSEFNLQMSGNLGDDIEILAAISDQNIPLQPEGNTQQLQEFDRIFIQIKRKSTTLTAGDYDLLRPNSYFMNYQKRLQGASILDERKLGQGILKNKASFAIARGNFARQNLNTQEGNQGPYRLRGNNGEIFVIVLAGTEKVFLDGMLLERGLNNDYVIDYNRGEITFTSNRLITKDVRIIVEFEYTDQTYLRFLYATSSAYETDRLSLRLNTFTQQDSRSTAGNQDLSENELLALAQAGDNLDNAFATGIDTLEEFQSDRISYKQIDSLYEGIVYPILVYSTAPDSALYTARFTEVGEGNGNYRLATTAANGRVYAWVAPINGTPSGNYEPIVRVIAPQQQQLITLGASYKLNKRASVNTEIALSNNDLNRFSNLDADDNLGVAAFAEYLHRFHLDKDENWTFNTSVKYEFLQKHFKTLNPYRVAEFARDWNYDNTAQVHEGVGTAAFSLNRKNWASMTYDLSVLTRQNLYTGFKHNYNFSLNKNGYQASVYGSWLNTNTEVEETNFSRPRVEFSKTFKNFYNWKIGTYGEQEKNNRRLLGSDTLAANSIYYDLYRFYVENKSNKNWSLRTSFQQRYDYAPLGDDFVTNTLANEVGVEGEWKAKSTSQLRWNFTYRDLNILDENLTTQKPLSTYLGRLNHNLNIAKGSIRSNLTYEVSSGQEPRSEFAYQKVNDGEGIYQWIDRNQDSIPQINEFEIANFQDEADYIRVNTFTDQFIRTNTVLYNHSLNIDPRAIWYKEEGVKAFFSKFSSQSTLRINRKIEVDDGVSPWNPFELNIADSSLVATTAVIRNTLFFNRANPIYELQLGRDDTRNRRVLTTGYEGRLTEEQFFRARWNISKMISFQNKVTLGKRANDSEFFDERDYQIKYFGVAPKLTFLLGRKFRAELIYQFDDSKNTLGEKESLLANRSTLELTFSQPPRTAVRGRFTFANIAFKGQLDTPVSYAMLEGLQRGQNYLWNISFDRQLSKNIQLNITYEGRKTGDNPIIHVGRAQVRAIF